MLNKTDFIVCLKLIPLFNAFKKIMIATFPFDDHYSLRGIAPQWAYIDHSIAELDKCSSGRKFEWA